MEAIMRIFLFLILLSFNIQAEEYKHKRDLIPNDDYKTNAILNTCVWKADIAQGVQIARQTEPQYNKKTSEHKVRYLLRDTEKWHLEKIIEIHNEVWERFSTQLSSTKVFVEIYNECVREVKTKLNDLHEQKEFI